MAVTTNELKKGTRIQLANGWFGTIKDNGRGVTRVAEVEGFCTETGSVYSHDIALAMINDQWVPVAHTDKQMECRATVRRVAMYE